MKGPVVSLPSSRRVNRVRQLHSADDRFRAWQQSYQPAAAQPLRHRAPLAIPFRPQHRTRP